MNRLGKHYGRQCSSHYSRGTIRVKVPPTEHRRGYTAVRPDLGKHGIGPKLIPIMEKGSLSKYGYSTKKSEPSRREALKKAIKKYGALSVARKLQAQVILRKRTQPQTRRMFEQDLEWVRSQYKEDGFVS